MRGVSCVTLPGRTWLLRASRTSRRCRRMAKSPLRRVGTSGAERGKGKAHRVRVSDEAVPHRPRLPFRSCFRRRRCRSWTRPPIRRRCRTRWSGRSATSCTGFYPISWPNNGAPAPGPVSLWRLRRSWRPEPTTSGCPCAGFPPAGPRGGPADLGVGPVVTSRQDVLPPRRRTAPPGGPSAPQPRPSAVAPSAFLSIGMRPSCAPRTPGQCPRSALTSRRYAQTARRGSKGPGGLSRCAREVSRPRCRARKAPPEKLMAAVHGPPGSRCRRQVDPLLSRRRPVPRPACPVGASAMADRSDAPGTATRAPAVLAGPSSGRAVEPHPSRLAPSAAPPNGRRSRSAAGGWREATP